MIGHCLNACGGKEAAHITCPRRLTSGEGGHPRLRTIARRRESLLRRLSGSKPARSFGSGAGLLPGCLGKALPAQNRAPLGRAKGDGSLLAANGANRGCFDLAGDLSHVAAGCGYALRLAGAAALGFIFELLFEEERLFGCAEYKLTAAVDTLKSLVLEFHRGSP